MEKKAILSDASRNLEKKLSEQSEYISYKEN